MNRTSNFANIVFSTLIALTLILSTVQVVDVHAASATSLEESRSFSPDPADIDRFVSPTGADSGVCIDKNNPCLTITYAFDQVAADGEIIAVAEGIYKNIDPNKTKVVELRVSTIDNLYGANIYGGWNSDFSSQVGFSIIDGENQFRGVSIYGYPKKSFVLDHFIIRNGLGGGIYSSGMDLDVTNGSIYNNNNIGDYQKGGGIYNNGGALTLYNLTVHGNYATSAGGGIASSGTTVMTNITVINNTAGYEGGGIRVDAGVISNSIIFGNHATYRGPDCYAGTAGTSNNIVGDTSDCSIFSVGNGNQLNVNPVVGNFIEGVGYQPLLAGSPAINSGSGCYGTADQRGYPRVGNCDIGAYEYPSSMGAAAQFVIAGGNFQRTAPNTAFKKTLAVAVLDDQGSPVSGQAITFSAPVSGAGGTFAGGATSIQVTTGADGVASAAFTANDQIGTYTVTADYPGFPAIAFTLQNMAWFVKPDGNDANDCLSPATACANIYAAMDKLSAGDTINVASGVYTGAGLSIYDGSIVWIDKQVFIEGGWDSTFTVQDGYSTIDGEDTRAAIANDASGTTLNRFILINGDNGGLSNSGSLTVTNSIIRDNFSAYGGGGVNNSNILTLDRVLIFNNKGQIGGGIHSPNGISLTIMNSAIFNNVAGYGGGIDLGGGVITINNSTISGNVALEYGGGIRSASNSVTLNNVTISNNYAYKFGGGVYNSNTNANSFTIMNTILADNTAKQGGPDCGAQVALGSVKSGGHSIISNTTGCIYVAGSGDLTNVDAGLGSFLPSRGYHPILSGSPAINNGAGCYGATDQRGVARVGQCDIGAYEYDPIGTPTFMEIAGGDNQRTAPNFTFSKPFSVAILDENGSPVSGVNVTFSAPASGPSGVFANQSNVDAPVLTDNSGIGTATVFTANDEYGNYTVAANSAVGSVYFDASNFNLFVDPGGSDTNDCQSVVAACATIDGAIAKALENDTIYVSTGVFTSSSGNQVVNITQDIVILGGWDSTFSSLDGTTVIDAQGVRGGVNIPVGVTARMQNFTIQNAGGYYKYAIWNAGNFTVDECLLIKNGSGIYNKGTLVATNCRIQGNATEGIYNDGHLTLTEVIINNNQGKGIYNQNSYGVGIVSVNSSIISNNLGPGIYNQATLFISRSSISENSAPNGAGIYAVSGSVTLENSTMAGNVARGPGGGIYIVGGTFLINNATISGNSASSGGGIYQSDGASISIQNSILGGNTITSGTGPDCSGIVNSLGANIISSDSGCTLGVGTGDLRNINPLLGVFISIRGYQPLLPGSPAINSGNAAACLAIDQRGVARVGTCDRGAYEYVTPGAAVEIVIVDGDDQHIPSNESPVWPLRVAALDAIGSPVSGVSITFTAPPSGPSGIFADTHTFATTVQTAVDGVAASPEYITNNQLGAYVVTASSSLGNIAFNLKNLVWFVSPDGSNSNTCLAPASPCADIIGALGKAEFYSGDIIWIKKGTYDLPGVTYMEILKSASLVGGWNNDFTAQDDTAVLKDSVLIPFYSLARRVVRISQVTFDGAGIYSNGNVLFLERSSIINSPAGGVGIAGGQLTITNSTIGNSAANAVDVQNNGSVPSPVSIIASTIIGNVQNDAAVGTVYVASSIIASCGGDFSSNGYNVIGNAGNPNLFNCGGWLATDVVGGSTPLDLTKFINTTLTQDPRSGQWHYPLVYHSVASDNKTIDKVPVGDGCPGTDQLGVPRPQSTSCDIGASEYIFLPGATSLVAPGNNVLLTDYTPTLDWSDSKPLPDHYEIQIASDVNFTVDVRNYSSAISTYTLSDALPSNAMYYWRVRGVNFVGDASIWSATRSFRTALPPPVSTQPGNLYPGTAVNIHTRRPTFEWDSVPGATGYTVEVAATNYCGTFSTKALSATATTNSYTAVKDLTSGAVYCWRVKATGANGPSLYSQVRTFTTGNPPTVPTLSAPANTVLLTSTVQPLFDWANSTLPTGTVFGYYEFQIDTSSTFSAPTTFTTLSGQITDSDLTPPTAGFPVLNRATNYYWRVRAWNAANDFSGWSAPFSFRIAYDVPVSVSPGNLYPGGPADNVHTRRPEFTWSVVPGATGYTVEVVASQYCTSFSTKALTASMTTNSYTATKDLAAGTVYCWRVRATGTYGPSAYSQVRTFTTGNPPSVPKLSAPANNALLTSTAQPLFDWANSTLPTGTVFSYYEYQIDTTSTFTTATSFSTAPGDITDSDLTPPTAGFPVLNRATTYYWRVRAWNAAGDYIGWSVPFGFRIAYETPVLLSPANGATLTTLKPTFTWNPVFGATSYKIQVSTSSTFGTTVVNVTVSLPTYIRTTSLTAHKTYYWRVQALGTYGPSAWSTVWSFITP